MKISTVRNAFTQFGSHLDIRVSENGAVLNAGIEKSELAEFALMLMDVADDCLKKLDGGYDEAIEALNAAMIATREAREG